MTRFCEVRGVPRAVGFVWCAERGQSEKRRVQSGNEGGVRVVEGAGRWWALLFSRWRGLAENRVALPLYRSRSRLCALNAVDFGRRAASRAGKTG